MKGTADYPGRSHGQPCSDVRVNREKSAAAIVVDQEGQRRAKHRLANR